MQDINPKELTPEHMPVFMEFVQFSTAVTVAKTLNKQDIEDFFNLLEERCNASKIDEKQTKSYISIMKPVLIEMREAFEQEEIKSMSEIKDLPPNSQECIYYGRKLSNIGCDDIHTSDGYVIIGSDNDDEIYFGECLKGEMLKERVSLTLMKDGECGVEQGFSYEIDLEDVLRFAAYYCSKIYNRVRKEVKPYKEQP